MSRVFGVFAFIILVLTAFYISKFVINLFGWWMWIMLMVSVYWYVNTFNTFISLQNTVQNCWGQINVRMQRRYDLVENLVQTVKGYTQHEMTTFTEVTRIRGNIANPRSMNDAIQAQDMLTSAVKSLFAVAEAYPDLKANQGYLLMQQELASIEDEIARAREQYNDAVRNWNIYVESWLSQFVAYIHGFKTESYIQSSAGASNPVAVSF